MTTVFTPLPRLAVFGGPQYSEPCGLASGAAAPVAPRTPGHVPQRHRDTVSDTPRVPRAVPEAAGFGDTAPDGHPGASRRKGKRG